MRGQHKARLDPLGRGRSRTRNNRDFLRPSLQGWPIRPQRITAEFKASVTADPDARATWT